VSVALFALELLGPFRLLSPGARRIDISSKKAQAMIAMLAVSPGGERTRSWLQGQLWGSRAQDQAQASLRNELSGLRATLNAGDRTVIQSDKNRVWLDLSHFKVDARERLGGGAPKGDFLEGLDIPGEEGFEDWLREERARFAASATAVVAAAQGTAPLPPKEFATLPALAILPFANLTGDAAQDFLAEGISEDLIDRLARLRWLPIIARGSSFAFRDVNQDPKAVGEALGARYVLEGRVRRQGTQQMLNTALVNSENGQQLWSTKVNVTDDSAPEVLENLVAGLASTLGSRIDQEEQTRALQKPQSDLNVRDLIWRGRWHLNRMTKEDSAEAKACFAEALAKEPNSPEAIIQNAWARAWELWARRGTETEIKELRQMAQKAIIADCDDARGHMLAGIAEIWMYQPLRAEALLRRAIELNPSLVMAHVQLGASLRVRDEHELAIEAFNAALLLSPNDHDIFFTYGELGASCLMLGRYEEALKYSEFSIARRRAYWFPHVIKVNALVRLKRPQEARAALAELRVIKPDFMPKFIDWSPFTDLQNSEFLKAGLNLAAE
jgi:TolB-like protein